MNSLKFKPEGWNNEVTPLTKTQIKEYIENHQILQGLVKNCDEDYNLHIQFQNGIKGIMPRQEIEAINIEESGLPRTNLCTGKVHKFVQFQIQKTKEDNQIILSRKAVQTEALEWVKNELKEGERVVGIVKNIRPYGAFIEIGGGIVGLVHIEDLSIARIKTPFERLRIGQKVEVMIKSINRNTGKVILSYKETLGTWEENAEKFIPGTKAKGIIRETEKNKNGIFIELAPNLVGMAEYEKGLTYGETVEVYIKKIDNQRKKIKLVIV